ncbi:hypothetical protein [Kiloniella sp.]|uniref:hypothetical protein n=1 Tax=Kiloniella sp. TaxID=1938587 RepID=UPI003B010F50
MKKNPLERAREELIEGEELIWADSPDPNRRMSKKRKAAIFGKVIIAVVFLWMLGVIMTSFSTGKMAGLALALFGLPFMFMASKLINKPKVAKSRAEQTFYVLTNRRLMIIDDYKKKSVVSYDIDKLDFLERAEHNDGTGDILFTKSLVTSVPTTDRDNAPPPKAVTREVKKGFLDIHEAKLNDPRQSRGLKRVSPLKGQIGNR